jgi:DNA polymerase-4
VNIKTGADLKQQTLPFLLNTFGKAGQYYYNIARGIDHRPVNNHRASKSIGVETTFQQDIKARSEILMQLNQLLNKALCKLDAKKLTAQTLTIKIKYDNFVQITRSQTLAQAISDSLDCTTLFEHLLKDTDIGQRKVRLLGITLSSLHNPSEKKQLQQMDLFDFQFK